MIEIDKNINKAKTLSSKFYTNDDIFEQSKGIFEDSAQIICSVSELSDLISYPFIYFPKFLDENLLYLPEDLSHTFYDNMQIYMKNPLQ